MEGFLSQLVSNIAGFQVVVFTRLCVTPSSTKTLITCSGNVAVVVTIFKCCVGSPEFFPSGTLSEICWWI